MKYVLFVVALLSAVPVFADDCLDAGVRFKSFANTGSNEIYLGQPDLGEASNRVESEFHWEERIYPFAFTYNTSGGIEVAIGDTTLEYTVESLEDIDTLLVDIASRDFESSVELFDLELGGVSFDTPTTQGELTRQVFPIDVSGMSRASITGKIELKGHFSNSSEKSRVEIRIGKDTCDLLPPPVVPDPPPLPEALPVYSLNIWTTLLLALSMLSLGWFFLRK